MWPGSEQEAPVNVFRGAAILVAVAISRGATGAVTPQFDPAKAAWRVRATNHFEIYYPQTLDVGSIPREAERAYADMSRERHQQVSGKVPLMLLPTAADLPRTEQEAAVIVRASGAPARDHLMLAVEPRNGRESRLANGLMHIFEFEGHPRRD
jgi:hypothetical protein